MANTTFNVPRSHLTMALCLPLAVLLGYVLAEPLESGSLAVIVFVLVILSVPLVMRWHHPLLIFGWNAAVNPLFLPGHAHLWLYLSAVSFFFAVLNRATNPDERFVNVPSITKPMLALAGIVTLTGVFTGGFGTRLFGSSQYGGGRYFYLLGAIVGYFALTSRRIPIHRARLYGGIFFLSGVTAIISNLAFLGGPAFYFLYFFFDPGYAMDQAQASVAMHTDLFRLGSLTAISPAVYSWLFARYGIAGTLDLTKPWRLLLLIGAVGGSLFGGFRSIFILFVFTFAILFFLEGLHRTKYLLVMVGVISLTGVLLVPLAHNLPLAVQRTLSVLPLNLDARAKESATASSNWRLEMWKVALKDVPKHILRGKGYYIDPQDVGQTVFFRDSIHNESWSGALLMGDYHNGPLSVIIPFGVYGTLAFFWFLLACVRLMWRYLKAGHPDLRTINALLLAAFAAKALLFFFVFGALSTDMACFAGLIGLSVAINGAPADNPVADVNETTELDPDLNHGFSPSS